MVSPAGVGCTPMVLRGRADLHLHTTASDGWPAPHQLVDYARATRLDVIAVTDHDTIEGALRAADYAAGFSKLHVVIGEEVSSRDGHIVALYVERRIRPGMSAAATVHAIHEQGGLAVAVHPFWRTQRRTRNGSVNGVGWLAAELDFDAVEVENATPGFYVFNQLARRLNTGLGSAELGGSDAHILAAVARAFTMFPRKSSKALPPPTGTATPDSSPQPYPALRARRNA